MVAIKNIIFVATSVAALAVKRDFNTVQKDLTTINNDVTGLDNAIKSYTGGFNGALQVQSYSNTLDNDVKSATTDAQNTQTVTSSQATSVINYINNTLEPNIKKTIADLNSKYSTFKTDGVQCQVNSNLNTLKTDTASLSNALIAITPSGQQAAAGSARDKILADIQSGINTYSPGC